MRTKTIKRLVAFEFGVLVFFLLLLLFKTVVFVPFPDNWFWALSAELLFSLFVTLISLRRAQKQEGQWFKSVCGYEESVGEVLYQSGQDELRFTKTLQWNMLYYILLAFAVLFSLGRLLPPGSSPHVRIARIAIYALNCAVLNYGLYFIFELQYKLRNYRIQLDKTPFFRVSFIENGIFNERHFQKELENDKRFWRDLRIIIIFLISSILGFFFVAINVFDSLRISLQTFLDSIVLQ